jgi:hypothetical protein
MKKRTSILVTTVILVLGLVGVALYAWLSQDTKSGLGTCTTNNGTIDRQCTGDYVGLPVSEAVSKAEKNGLFPKITKRDGKSQNINDIGSSSIYFEVENDVVKKAYFEQDRK